MKLLLLIFFAFGCSVFAESIYSIRVNESNYSVKALNHYDNDLISLNQISRFILPNSKVIKDKNIIQANDYTITYSPGVIYIVKENWLGKRVAQLDLPVLQMKQNIYFPLKSFLLSLDTLNIYNVLVGEDNKHYFLADNNFSGLAKLPKLRSFDELIDESKNYITPRNNFINDLRNDNKSNSNKTNDIRFESGDGLQIKIKQANPFRDSYQQTSKTIKNSINLLKPEEFKPTKTETKEVPKEVPKTEYLLPEELIRKELEEIKNNPIK